MQIVRTDLARLISRTVFSCALCLSIAAQAADEPEVAYEAQVEQEALLRRPAMAEDPTDGETKAMLTAPERRIRTWVTEDGFALVDTGDPTVRADLTVEGWDGVNASIELTDDAVVARSFLDEQQWYNVDGGIEHVLVLGEGKPVDGDEYVVVLHASGLSPAVGVDGNIELRDASGLPRILYRNLVVFDDSHRIQTSWFEASGDLIEIHFVLDADALWPITIDPLAQGAQTIVGSQVNAKFGYSTATADLDGDGYVDAVIGEPLYDRTDLFSYENAGKVYILWGSSSGLGNLEAVHPGFETAHKCGTHVAAGDRWGNGYVDICTSCPGADGGKGEIICWSGEEAYSSGGIKGYDDSTSSSRLGDDNLLLFSLDGSAGLDVIASSNDGVHVWSDGSNQPVQTLPASSTYDVTLAPMFLTPSARGLAIAEVGQARVYRTDAATGLLDPTSEIRVPSSRLGSSTLTVIGATDLHGDGDSDLFLGMPFENSGDGKVWLYLNNEGVFSLAPGFPMSGSSGEHFGSNFASADFNADRLDDTVICSESYLGGNGRCRVFSGSTNGFEQAPVRWKFVGPSNSSRVGWRGVQISAGTFTKDGAPDLLLPEPNYENSSGSVGAVRVFDGDVAGLKTSSQTYLQPNVSGAALGNDHGSVVSYDLNGDGYEDVIAGAPGYDSGRGAFYVFMGSASMNSTADFSCVGPHVGSRFGASIAVGRFRGASYPPSIAVGAPEYSSFYSRRGRVAVYHGDTSGPTDCGVDLAWNGSGTSAALGASLANVGNALNTAGDGLAMGEPGAAKTSSSTGGTLRLYKSTGSGLSWVKNFYGTDAGINCDQTFGWYVANAGNVDNRYRDDILVGAPYCSSGHSEEGKAFLLTSDDAGFGVSLSTWTYEANQASAHLGVVAGVGDTNRDGIDDMAVGAPDLDTNSTDNGRLFIFLGRSGQVPSTSPSRTMSTSYSSGCGSSIAGGRDFNRDGYMDVVVGEPRFSNNSSTPDEGRIRVFHGGSGGPDWIPEHTVEANVGDRRLGAAVAAVNVNGDDYGDLAGAWPGYSGGETGEGGVNIRLGQW